MLLTTIYDYFSSNTDTKTLHKPTPLVLIDKNSFKSRSPPLQSFRSNISNQKARVSSQNRVPKRQVNTRAARKSNSTSNLFKNSDSKFLEPLIDEKNDVKLKNHIFEAKSFRQSTQKLSAAKSRSS